MSTHTIVEAQERLSELIDSAIAGEDVLISREGRPVVALQPIPQPTVDAGGATRATAMDRLAAHRAGVPPARKDAGTLVSEMRDEEARW
jgi:prevent-host-death family protein